MGQLKGPTAEEKQQMQDNYAAAEYYAMFASAISGGIESPCQFIIQVNPPYIEKLTE